VQLCFGYQQRTHLSTRLNQGGLFCFKPKKGAAMIKVHILDPCRHCNGQAYLPAGEAENYTGEKYTRYTPCPNCDGSGLKERWISLQEFALLLVPTLCQHQDTTHIGQIRFSDGEVWDDIREVCSDCEANLDNQT
jgi:hypothetical protein